jgi:preprotein translocase subunit YajC
MSFLISPAYAAGGQPAGSSLELVFMVVLFAVIFYFMIYRPQARRAKDHKNLMSSLSKGDEVLTTGGIVGRIIKVGDDSDYIQLNLTGETNVVIKKDYISAVLPKGTLKSL